jgi:hypothetical protein
MILVASTTIGLAILRFHYAHEIAALFEKKKNNEDLIIWLLSRTATLEYAFLALLVSWTLAILGLRLLPPRPPIREVVLQPGAAACMSVTFMLSVRGIDYLARTALAFAGRVTQWPYIFIDVIAGTQAPAGYAIASVWGLLALSRQWRSEPTWTDRGGRAIGLLWLAVFFCNWGLELMDFVISFEP